MERSRCNHCESIRNSRRTAWDAASETREEALAATELAELEIASIADESAWAQTAAAKTGRRMEERMVKY